MIYRNIKGGNRPDTKGTWRMGLSYFYTSLTDRNFFREVIECAEPVLVVFTHESSGNLQIVSPVLDQVLPKFAEGVKIGYMDVNLARETAAQYRIQEVPTLLFFSRGVVVDYLIGLFRKKDLVARLQNLLSDNSKDDGLDGTTARDSIGPARGGGN